MKKTAPDRKRPDLGGVGEAGKLSVRKAHFYRDMKTGEKEVAWRRTFRWRGQ